MLRIIKWLFFIGAGLALLILLGITLLVVFIDPNDYRDDISRIIQDKTGVHVDLKGDVSWRVYPVLGVGINDVSVAMADNLPVIAKIKEAGVGVKVAPLFSRKVEVDAIDVNGLSAHLLVDDTGTNNWSTGDTAATEPETAPNDAPNNDNRPFAEITIPRLRIHNSSILYEDTQKQTLYTVDLKDFLLTNVNLNTPFAAKIDMGIKDRASLDVGINLTSDIKVDLAAQQYALKNIQLRLAPKGMLPNNSPITIRGDMNVDQSNDTARLHLPAISLQNATLALNLTAQNLSQDLTFTGNINAAPFNAHKLLSSLKLPLPAFKNTDILQNASFNTNISGSSNTMLFKPIDIKFDNTTIKGEAGVKDISTGLVDVDLNIDSINIDKYLPENTQNTTPTEKPANAASAASQESETSSSPLIPLEPIRTLNANVALAINELTFKDMPIHDIKFALTNRDSILNIGTLKANIIGATLNANATINAKEKTPTLKSQLAVSELQISDILSYLKQDKLLSGKFNFKTTLSSRGNDIDSLLQQSNGNLALAMSDGVFHGLSIRDVAANSINEKLGNFAALLPDYEKKLPRQLKKDTSIRKFSANMDIKDGVVITPPTTAETGEGNFTSEGTFDLANKAFDYKLSVVLDALNSNKYLKDSAWPVHCKGNITMPPSQWCKPDTQAFDKILTRAARKSATNKVAEKIGEKLGIENADRSKLEEKAKEKIAEEKQELKEKINNKLNEKLKDLFSR